MGKLGGGVGMRPRRVWACVVFGMLSLVGCAGDDDGGGGTGGPTVPFEPGDPIEAEPMTWTYVPVAGTKCRDGQETGLGININPSSNKLIFYFEGGGACFNDFTCAANPRSWGASSLGTPNVSVLSRTSDENPFKDWNLVYIPYCTGDVFTGTKTSGGFGGDPQQGYINVGLYLERVVPTFPDIDQVVLSGSSAGGFGVAWNTLRTQDAFGDIPVYTLDDSGPPMGPMYFTNCLAQRMATTWGWEDSLHPACRDCDLASGDVIEPLLDVATSRAGSQRFALLSNTEDSVIKLFYSFGLNDCASIDSGFPGSYPSGSFPMGLDEQRQRAEDLGLDNVKMWIKDGSGHTFLGNIYSVESEGVPLVDWIEQFYTDDPAWETVFPAL